MLSPDVRIRHLFASSLQKCIKHKKRLQIKKSIAVYETYFFLSIVDKYQFRGCISNIVDTWHWTRCWPGTSIKWLSVINKKALLCTAYTLYLWLVWFLWCLTPLSTIFQIYRGGFIGGWNRRTRRKPLTCRKSLTNFIT